MAPFAVYADDYTYIPIEDIEQYNAYKFWSLYGYDLDYTNTVSYTISESGTYTANYHGNLTTSFSGSESSSVNLHISNYTGAGALQNTMSYGGYIAYQPSTSGGIGSEIDITLDADLTNNPTSAAPFVCRATSSSGASDWEYNEFTCTTTGGAGYQMFPDYDVTVDAFNVNNNGIGTFTVDLQNQGNSVGNFSGSLGGSNSGSLNGSISLSGTESTTNYKIYDIPMIKNTVIDNSFNLLKRFTANKNDPFVVAFIDTNNTWVNNNYLKIYKYDDTDRLNDLYSNLFHRISESNVGGYFLHSFELYSSSNNNSDNYIFDLLGSRWNKEMIPIYIGYKNRMSDKTYRYIYNSDRTDTLLESGNSNSQQAITNNESMTNSFSQASEGMHNIETTWENNLDTNLQNVPTSSSMYNDNKFIASANWVRTQFERIVLNTPFELLLVFSLILGIALVLIGKVR